MGDENMKGKAPEDTLKEATLVVIPVNNKFRILRYTVWGEGGRVEVSGLAFGGSPDFDDEEKAIEAATGWAEEMHEATGAYIEVLETVYRETFGERQSDHDQNEPTGGINAGPQG